MRELGSRAKYSEAAADQDTRMLDELKVAEEQLGIQRKDLEHEKGEAQKRTEGRRRARAGLEQTRPTSRSSC